MIETGAYWVGKSNGNHGNCTGVLCRCSVCGHEHTFFAYSLEPCANCGRTMKGMKNVPFKRELIVPRDVSPEALNLAEQVLTMIAGAFLLACSGCDTATPIPLCYM